MACIVPKCSCTVFKKVSSKNRPLLLRFTSTTCSGCNHHSQLHRNYTSKDGLIIRELNAGHLNRCTGLIPMSKLDSCSLFNNFSLIPLISDGNTDSVFKQSDVACVCSGFHFKDISTILLQFNKLSYDNVMQELPQVLCDHCTHPLINHQPTVNESSNISQFTHHDVIAENIEDSSLLIDVASCDSHVTICIISKDTNNDWKLFCKSYRKPLINNAKNENIESKKSSRSGKKRSREDNGDDVIMNELGQTLKGFVNEQHDHLLSLPKISPCYLSCVCNESTNNDNVTVCVGDYKIGLVCVYYLTKQCHDQVYSVKPLETLQMDGGSQLSMILLTTRGSYLCVGTDGGQLTISAAPFNDKASNVNITATFGFNTTCCCSDDSERYLFVGYESGKIFCFCMKTGSRLYTEQLCSGPIRCLTWIKESRGVAIGSADGHVYLLTILSSQINDGPINKYFAKKQKHLLANVKFKLSTIYEGHSSFVSCICTHGNSLVTAGWDGLIMIWPHPLAIIQGNEISPLIEDEPNKIMKIGTQSFPALIPIAIYSVTNEAILCMYKNMNNKDSLILYY